MLAKEPYFMKNEDWYDFSYDTIDLIRNNGRVYFLLDAAPEKAKKSYMETYGLESEEEMKPPYFIRNHKWYKKIKEPPFIALTDDVPDKAKESFDKFVKDGGVKMMLL